MRIKWCAEKNRVLKFQHGISFGRLLQHPLVGIGHHPTRANQKMMFFEQADYIWVVPFVVGENEIFLKTLYPSRKYTRLYKEGKLNEEENRLE